MNIVLIVPTGIGAEIGGHAGDAGPVAKLIGACCDTLILHPNVVNGSDINAMPPNSLYVEGSILDRFLRGEIELQKRRHNKILVATNKPVKSDTINAVSAARAAAGISADIIELGTPLTMTASMKDGIASGDVTGYMQLAEQVCGYEFDALALHTPISVSRETQLGYFRNGGVNPWGGVEAKASKLIADLLNKPVAHAPIESVEPDDVELYNIGNQEAVDPRMAAEVISTCYLHCVLKGLNQAPVIGKGLCVADVEYMISPYGCYGPPHMACIDHGVRMIFVKENKVITDFPPPAGSMVVENYWEAAGIIMAERAGINARSVRRPLPQTKII